MSMPDKDGPRLGRLTKRLLKLSLPTASVAFVSNLAWILVLFMIARLGKEQLAAAGWISLVNMICLVANQAFLSPVSVFVSNFCGANKQSQVGNILHNSVLIIVIGFIPTLLLLWNIKSILLFFGQPPIPAALAGGYFRITLLGFIPMMINVLFSQFLVGIRRPTSLLVLVIISTMITVSFGYCFIFGKFGFPALGMRGAALAILLSAYIGLGIRVVYLLCARRFRAYNLLLFQPTFRHIKPIIKMGWPICIDALAKISAMAVVTYMIGWLGASALATLQISRQVMLMVSFLFGGILSSNTILVARAYGANNFKEVRVTSSLSMGLGILISLIVCVLVFLFSDDIIRLYVGAKTSQDQGFLQLATTVLYFHVFVQPFVLVVGFIQSSLRALHETKIPMYIGLCASLFIALPLGYFFGFQMHWGVAGVLLGMVIGVVADSVAMTVRWSYKLKADFLS